MGVKGVCDTHSLGLECGRLPDAPFGDMVGSFPHPSLEDDTQIELEIHGCLGRRLIY